jgi:hypothetical protein
MRLGGLSGPPTFPVKLVSKMKTKQLRKTVRNDPRFGPWLCVADNPAFQAAIRQMEPGYVAVWNEKGHRYEIHDTESRGPETLCIVVEHPALDNRTIEKLWRTSFRYQGDAAKKMRARNAAAKAAKDRDFDNEIEARGLDTAHDIAYAMEKDDLHDGYKRLHTV